MAITTTTPNYSLFAIPTYFVLCLIPHLYSGTLLKVPKDSANKDPSSKFKAGKSFYDLPNPRGADAASKREALLDKSTLARFERARAAHDNLLENAPFVLSAILAGVVTKLPADYANTTAALYLATRVAYLCSYLTIEKGTLALSRTFCYLAGNAVLGAVFWQAGKKVMNGEI